MRKEREKWKIPKKIKIEINKTNNIEEEGSQVKCTEKRRGRSGGMGGEGGGK